MKKQTSKLKYVLLASLAFSCFASQSFAVDTDTVKDTATNAVKERSTTHKVSVATLKKRALQGDVKAQYLLGNMYEKGDNVAKDNIKARMYFKQACSNQSRLGCEGYRRVSN